MENLFQTYGRLIASCADKLCRRYQCPQFKEDLTSVGNIVLLEKAQTFSSELGVSMITYLYPFLMGAMRREIEKNLYPISLPKDEFEAQDHRWHLAFSSLDTRSDLEKIESVASVEHQVLQTIYLECLEKEFENLSFKERQILGSFFGVYGYCKQTASEIAVEFQMTENALLKAKNRALQKLQQACHNGKLGIWLLAVAAIHKAGCEYALDYGYSLPQHPWYMKE